jgi:hypothetical protein
MSELPTLTPGDLTLMTGATAVFDEADLRLTYSAGRNRRFIFLYLGSITKGDEVKAEERLNALGWKFTEGE